MSHADLFYNHLFGTLGNNKPNPMKKLIFLCLLFASCHKDQSTTPSITTTHSPSNYTILFDAEFFASNWNNDSNTVNSYYAVNGVKTYLPSIPFKYYLPSPIQDSVINIVRGDVFELYIQMKHPVQLFGLSIYQYASDSSGYWYTRTAVAICDSVFYPAPDTGTVAYLKYIAY
jgi:hypothetical protein